MAKRQSHVHRKRVAIPVSKRGRLVAIGVLASLILTAGVFAKLRMFSAAQEQRTSSKSSPPVNATPTSLLPATPRKSTSMPAAGWWRPKNLLVVGRRRHRQERRYSISMLTGKPTLQYGDHQTARIER